MASPTTISPSRKSSTPFGSAWNVQKVASRLRAGPLAASGGESCADALELTCGAVDGWARDHAGDRAWSSLLNHARICKEVEDSVLPLARVLSVVRTEERGGGDALPWRVLDLCSGKGFFAALLATICSREPSLRGRVVDITMVDSNEAIKWGHVPLLNAAHAVAGSEAASPQLLAMRTSVHSAEFGALVQTLRDEIVAQRSRVLVVGTHLCRRLSARAVEVFNEISGGSDGTASASVSASAARGRAVALLLAPCCLPRFGSVCVIRGGRRRAGTMSAHDVVSGRRPRKIARPAAATGSNSSADGWRPPPPRPRDGGPFFATEGEYELYALVCLTLLRCDATGGLPVAALAMRVGTSKKAIGRTLRKGRKAGELGCDSRSVWSINPADDGGGRAHGVALAFEAAREAEKGKPLPIPPLTAIISPQSFAKWSSDRTECRIDLFALGAARSAPNALTGGPFGRWVAALSEAVDAPGVRIATASLGRGAHAEAESERGNTQGGRRTAWIEVV